MSALPSIWARVSPASRELTQRELSSISGKIARHSRVTCQLSATIAMPTTTTEMTLATVLESVDVNALSNHSFGSAFDINRVDNDFGAVPAFCGRRGSVRELVASANEVGMFWGGRFNTQDGMHFEISKLP